MRWRRPDRTRWRSRYPHVPGIDAAGVVVASDDPAWKPGDRVLVTGYDFGAGRFGGWAQYARVPADWVVRVPDALSTRDAMAIGTAGYTAALCLLALERNGTTPAAGAVVVTAATGGVGALAVDMLPHEGLSCRGQHGQARPRRLASRARRRRRRHPRGRAGER